MTPLDLHAARPPMRPPAEKGLGQGAGLPQDQAPAGQRSRQAWLREMERAQMTDWFQPSDMGSTRGNGRGLETAAPTLRVSPAEAPARPAHGGAAASMRPVALAVALSARSAPVASGWPSSFTAAPMAGSAAGAPALSPRQAGSGLAAAAYAAAGAGAVPIPMPGAAQAASQAAPAHRATQAEVQRAFIASALSLPPAPLLAGTAAVALHAVSMPAQPDMAEPRAPAAAARENADAAPRRSASANPHWQNAALPQGMRMHAQWTDSGVQLWLGMDGNAQQTGAQALAVVYSLQRLLRDQGQQLSRLVCNGKVVFDAASRPPGAMRTPHEFSDIFDRLASSTRHDLPVFLSPSSKEIS